MIYIGIDTGVHTGIAIWDTNSKSLVSVDTVKIHKAMSIVADYVDNKTLSVKVRVEDARQRQWYGQTGREKLQGAGSVKRDAVIWEDFLLDCGANFEMVAPRNNITKLDAATFARSTGWTKRCSNHARDAAGLVYGF